ncbi:hypothetical protein YC2023_023417 [Brassica napus]
MLLLNSRATAWIGFSLIFIIKLLSAVSNVKLTSSTEIHSSIAIRFTFLAKFIEITTPPTTIFTQLFRFQNFGHLTSLSKIVHLSIITMVLQ